MPELPELDAVAHQLTETLAARRIAHIDLAAMNVLKSVDPPLEDLVDHDLVSVMRRGKYLIFQTEELSAVVHLALAGWLKVTTPAPAKPPTMGRGPTAFRLKFAARGGIGDFTALDVTEQGTRKSVALWVTGAPESLEALTRLGPDADQLDQSQFADILSGTSSHLKTVLTDQRRIAGIGNAWSDEILYRARLSPFATANSLSAQQSETLFAAMRDVLREAGESLRAVAINRMKAKKKSLFRVHGKTGQTCPACDATIAQVVFADRSLQYCPGCQTGGRRLSDRRMDRLLK